MTTPPYPVDLQNIEVAEGRGGGGGAAKIWQAESRYIRKNTPQTLQDVTPRAHVLRLCAGLFVLPSSAVSCALLVSLVFVAERCAPSLNSSSCR